MHKKIVADLTSLAHSILQLKNKEDVLVLKQKAYELYEKLTILFIHRSLRCDISSSLSPFPVLCPPTSPAPEARYAYSSSS